MKKHGCCAATIICLFTVQLLLCIVEEAFSGSTPKNCSFFTFQVETLSNKHAADKMVQQLIQKGYPAFVFLMKTSKGKALYKVRIGQYKTRAEVDCAGSDFKKNEKKPFFIVQSNNCPSILRSREKTDTSDVVFTGGNKSNCSEKIIKENAKKKARNIDISKDVDLQPVATGETYFTVQVKSLQDKNAADLFVNYLKQKDYRAYISEMKTSKGRILHKVRIGKYRRRADAEKVYLNYSKTESKDCFIVKSSGAGVKSAKVKDAEEAFAFKKKPVSNVQKKHALKNLAKDRGKSLSAVENSQRIENPTKKIFAYRSRTGALSLTNNYDNIPEDLRCKIEYVSLFPVKLISITKQDACLVLNVDDKKIVSSIAGVSFPLSVFTELAISYFNENLKDVPARLKYKPSQTAKRGTVNGRFYLRDGTYVNLAMVRSGIGKCCYKTVPPGQEELFKDAERLAKKAMVGIWSDLKN